MESTTSSKPTKKQEPEKRRLIAGDKFPQYMNTVLVSIGALIIGTVLGWSSPSLKHLENFNSTAFVHVRDKMEAGLIAAWTPVGAIFGGLFAGFCADFFGRRGALMVFTFPWVLSWLVLCMSPFIQLLHVARFISGCIAGLFCGILPMYVAEISENSIRGTLGMFFQIFLSTGVVFIYLLGIMNSYHAICGIGGCVTALYLIALYHIPESPIHLLRNGHEEEAIRSLKMLRGPEYDVQSEIVLIKRELRDLSRENTSLAVGLTKPNLKAVELTVSLMIIQQFTGINAMVFFGEAILDAGKVPKANIIISMIGLLSAIATVFSIFLIDRLGRRILLMISTIGMTFCSAILGYFLQLTKHGKDVSGMAWIPVLSFSLLIVVYALGLGPVPWLMTAELLMPEVKKFGTGITVATSWGGAAIIIFFFKPISDFFGDWYMFYVFSAIAAISTAYIYWRIPETKGKSMQEIRQLIGDRNDS